MSDEFSDVQNLLTQKHGIFANSEGLDDLSSVKKRFTNQNDPEQGIVLTSSCGNCGAPSEVLVNWFELVTIAEKKLPAGWYYDQRSGTLRVNQRCYRCQGAPIPWGMTPEEATKDVKAGVESRRLDPRQVQAWLAQLQAQPQI